MTRQSILRPSGTSTWLLAAAVALMATASGCRSIDCETVEALSYSWEVIGEEYRDYVQADSALSDEQKARRLTHATEYSALLDHLQSQCKEDQ